MHSRVQTLIYKRDYGMIETKVVNYSEAEQFLLKVPLFTSKNPSGQKKDC